MKNEADRWSLQLVILFDAEDGEASHKVSEYKENSMEVRIRVIDVDLSTVE